MANDIDRSITQEQFVTTVAHAARVGLDRAERAIEATLQTLAERIDAGVARDLTEELPDEVAPWLATVTSAERFDIEEFLRRVADREGVDIETAQRHAAAVFVALQRAVSRQEFAALSAQLPKDFAPLLPAGPDIDVISVHAACATRARRFGRRWGPAQSRSGHG